MDIVEQLKDRVGDTDQFYGFDDEEIDRAAIAEIERLRAKLAFVQRQMANNCDVDMEPCEPAKICLCAQQARERGYEQREKVDEDDGDHRFSKDSYF